MSVNVVEIRPSTPSPPLNLPYHPTSVETMGELIDQAEVAIDERLESSYPLLLLTGATNSESTLLDNYLFTPLPKSVVCTVMEKKLGAESQLLEENRTIDGLEPVDHSECNSDKNDDEVFSKVISDKPVTCRARATLPAKFLYFSLINKIKKEYGVFSKKEIPRKALFGPVEGCEVDDDLSRSPKQLHFLVETINGFKRIDVSSEFVSNWMRYVRPANHVEEQNLFLDQHGPNLYFTTLRKIKPNEELKVWYSPSYAKARKLIENINQKPYPCLSETGDKEDCTIWGCTRCPSTFNSATLLNLHFLTHAADNIEITENFTVSEIHNENSAPDFITNSGESALTCTICLKTFSNKSALACHFKSHAPEKVFDCPICNTVFHKLLHLKRHVHEHAVNGSFTCPQCLKNFDCYKHIRNHIRTYHGRRRYLCVKCSKRFPTLDKLKAHNFSHSKLREFLCANCGKQFKRKDKLSDHMKKVHYPGSEKVPPSPKVRRKSKMKCVPSKAIEGDQQLNLMSDSRFVYKCDICILGFKRRGMLVNHLANRHPEVTPDSIPELNLPILRANKEFYCQYCEKIYKSSSKRKAHILKNHPGKKLPLSMRQSSNSSKIDENDTFSLTVGSVTTNPHSCLWCHKQYASRAKLLQHQRKKHPQLVPKPQQNPPRPNFSLDDETDLGRDEMGKNVENEILFQDPLESNISECELSLGDSKFFSDGEYIIDAVTLKKAIKGELATDCSPETLAELGQIIESRPDQYFKVFQTSSGVTFARPIEVWDPLSACQTLSPNTTENSHLLN